MDRRDFLLTGAAAMGAPFVSFGAQPSSGHPELRYRQVHLDYHTSELIPDLAAEFDPKDFARTLQQAHVNSVTCFARCHHGMIYYGTKAFPERKHPHLNRKLLEEQIEACHALNIRVPIYTTVQWDYYTANAHPEWLVVDATGKPVGTEPFQPGFYRKLCFNSPYSDFLKAHTKEFLDMMPVDGIFFDIVQPNTECACKYCRKLMLDRKLDPADAEARRKFGTETVRGWMHEMTAFVRKFNKDATIFYNAGHIGPHHRPVAKAFTHWELESLPSGGWGYLDFPLKARFTRTTGMDSLGMTGKFHTSWGDFHSLKNKAALEYECFQMLALGAKCSVGDQLHPRGKLDPATYELIGSVYEQVEKKEPWCRGASPVVDAAVLTPEEAAGHRTMPPAAWGFTRLLTEIGLQFDVVDSQSDLSRYKLLILPDAIPVNDDLARKISAFVAKGGALLASHEAGLNPAKSGFAVKELGVEWNGDAPFSPDFIVPRGAIGKGLPATELVMYLKGAHVSAGTAAEVLAETTVPYFNRTWEHFSSHRHTPSAGKPGYPAVVRNGRTIYFAHPVFGQYYRNAPRWVKQMVRNAVDLLLPEPAVRVQAPSSTLVALNQQPRENRFVLHLLHYIPERRGQDFDTIEDVIPVRDVRVSMAVPKKVTAVTAVPQGSTIPFTTAGARIEFTVPVLNGHGMFAVHFG